VPNGVLGGWQLSSIVTIQSGRAGNINTNFGGRNSLAYTDGERPNATGLPLNLPSGERTLDHWFNTAAVAVEAQGQIGNIGRNVFRGPGQQSWDLSLHKNIRIGEKHNVSFRAETFNFANHPVFARPGLNPLTPSTWGQIRGTDSPMRQVQLGLKYTF
jgi:hypothetical protein